MIDKVKPILAVVCRTRKIMSFLVQMEKIIDRSQLLRRPKFPALEKIKTTKDTSPYPASRNSSTQGLTP